GASWRSLRYRLAISTSINQQLTLNAQQFQRVNFIAKIGKAASQKESARTSVRLAVGSGVTTATPSPPTLKRLNFLEVRKALKDRCAHSTVLNLARERNEDFGPERRVQAACAKLTSQDHDCIGNAERSRTPEEAFECLIL